jgi:signal transduction histidine kinase
VGPGHRPASATENVSFLTIAPHGGGANRPRPIHREDRGRRPQGRQLRLASVERGRQRTAAVEHVRPPLGIRSLRIAVVHLAAVAALLAVVEAALVVSGPVEPAWLVALFPTVAVVYVAAGAAAWVRRPSNRMGVLLVAGGVAFLLAGLANTRVPTLIAVGHVLATAVLAAIVHMLLAFPSGRLRTRWSRMLAASAYVVAIVLQAPLYLFRPAEPPYDVLELAPRPDLARIGMWVQRSVGSLVMLATAATLTNRLRAATPSQRRVLAPLYVYGSAAVLFIPLSATVVAPLLDLSPITVLVCQFVALALVPLAFAAALFRGGLARTAEVEELGAWLGADEAGRPAIRDALRAALGDLSVDLAFTSGDGVGYVDADGRAVELPAVGTNRDVVEVEVGGRRVGVIVYDATLIADPEVARAAGRVVAIAVDREQLTAQLRASQEALRDSRRRIVEAGDRERRRIAQDLHDGLQSRLVLLAVEATRAGAKNVSLGIRTAIDELRALVHDVMPPLLIEDGLYSATEDLVDRLPVPTTLVLPAVEERFPAALERTAYFVVAEALTNAVKHSLAAEVGVRLDRIDGILRIEIVDDGVGGATQGGRGLRGVADRVDAFGGRFTLDSPPGGGTRVVAEVPCGW